MIKFAMKVDEKTVMNSRVLGRPLPIGRLVAGLLLAVVILWAAFSNLANYPTLWWDEAIFSETAANLVQHGRYAFTVQSPSQLSDLDYRISVGPAIILPVALAYKFFGVGLTSGRLVAGMYLVFTFLALFLAGRRLFDTWIALVAVLLAFLGTDVLYWGRSVLGDVPALGLFLFGTWLLLGGLEQGSTMPLFIGGLFLGLAFDAKEFYGLACLVPLWFIVRQDRPQPRRLALRLLAYCLGVGLPVLAYVALKVVILGGLTQAVQHFLEQKALLRHEFFTPFTIGRVYPESFFFLTGHLLFLLGVLGGIHLWRRGRLSLGERLWLANFGLWTGVYLTAVFWHRFALPALFLAAPLAAQVLRHLLARLTAALSCQARVIVAPALTLGFFLWCFPLTGLDLMAAACTCVVHPPTRVIEYLKRHVSPEVLIETPEYELAFLDDGHRYHLMPAFFFIESNEAGVRLLNPRGRPYDFNRSQAEVLVLGSFGKSIFSQIYPPTLVERHWQRVARVDFYDIYVRRPPEVPKDRKTPRLTTTRRPATRTAGNTTHVHSSAPDSPPQ
jgi:hypothetical protein